MSTIYYDIECDFTQIPNHIILNQKISGTAKAIYFYIVMRLKQNAQWEFYDFDIMEHLKEGRDAFRRAKKELLEYGYLIKVKQNVGSDGKYKGCDYAIKKEPTTEKPTTEKPTTEKPTTENQYTNNNKQKNNINNKQSKKQTNTASGFSPVDPTDFSKNFKENDDEEREPIVKQSLSPRNSKMSKEQIQDFIKSYTESSECDIIHIDENGNRIKASYFKDSEQNAILQYILDRKGCKATERALKLVLSACKILKDELKTQNIPLESVFEKNNDGIYAAISRADGTPFQNLFTTKEVIIKKLTNYKHYDKQTTDVTRKQSIDEQIERRKRIYEASTVDIGDRFGFDKPKRDN